jgi:hypothetical protein
LELARYNYDQPLPPKYQTLYDEIKQDYSLFLRIVQRTFDDLEPIQNLKDFAKEAKSFPYSSILFAMKKDNIPQVSRLLTQRDIKSANLYMWMSTAIKHHNKKT